MKTKISIVVPCYNQADFLDEALQSVLKQTFENWECIIVNDGSRDLTEKVAKEWTKKDTRFIYLYKENGGLSSARNSGIKISKGQYILPLDSDDKIDKTYLKKIMDAFSANENLSIVYCDVIFFDGKKGLYNLPLYCYPTLLIQNCFVACSAFKKAVWENAKGYDENLKSFEDWDFWIRILDKSSEVYKIPEALFYYRKHKCGSLSNSFSSEPNHYFKLYDYIYDKNRSIYDAHLGNPILAFHDNSKLQKFNKKVKSSFFFKIYHFIKSKI